MSYNPRNPNGQATKANSSPVTLASDQDVASQTTVAAILTELQLKGVLSTVNSTTTPLGIGATFTGTGENTTNFLAVNVAIGVDRSGTLNVDFSTDNINWDQTQSYPITPDVAGVFQGFFYQFMCEAKYFRLRYVNGGVAQVAFRLQSIFKITAGTSEIQAINVPLLANTDALVTKGVIYGLTTGGGGGYVAVKVTPSGALTADITSNSVAVASQTTVAAILTELQLKADLTETQPVGVVTLPTISSNIIVAPNSTVTSFSATIAAQTLLSSNASRKAAYFYNGTETIGYLKLGSGASAGSYTLPIAASGFYELPPNPIYTGIITCTFSGSTSTTMMVTELT